MRIRWLVQQFHYSWFQVVGISIFFSLFSKDVNDGLKMSYGSRIQIKIFANTDLISKTYDFQNKFST